MDSTVLAFAFFVIFPGAVLAIAAFVVVLLFGMRRRPQPGTGLRLTEPRADGTRGLIGGTWTAMVHSESFLGSMGATLDGQDGRLELADGVLSFVPAGATSPAWSVPCAQLGVGRGLARPVRLVGPMGTVHCTVSHESVNRFSQNTLKDLREQRYADELVNALCAYGAHPA